MSIDGATSTATAVLGAENASLAETLIRWLTDGVRPARLFAPDVFADVSLPQWRLQATNTEELYAIRETGHTGRGRVSVEAWIGPRAVSCSSSPSAGLPADSSGTPGS